MRLVIIVLDQSQDSFPVMLLILLPESTWAVSIRTVRQLVNPVTVVVFELRASKHDWPMLRPLETFCRMGNGSRGGG